MNPDSETEMLKGLAEQEYKYGFVTNIESDTLPPGLNEDVIKFISNKKGEPKWLTDWRLKAYKIWLKMKLQKRNLEIKNLIVQRQMISCHLEMSLKFQLFLGIRILKGY